MLSKPQVSRSASLISGLFPEGGLGSSFPLYQGRGGDGAGISVAENYSRANPELFLPFLVLSSLPRHLSPTSSACQWALGGGHRQLLAPGGSSLWVTPSVSQAARHADTFALCFLVWLPTLVLAAF